MKEVERLLVRKLEDKEQKKVLEIQETILNEQKLFEELKKSV